ncbi:hypothetical protein CLOSTASPAR_04011 [[Clostridium] asparagiforme DSM 15981]|uniref:Uncharacterized protein n=1 Tax=[Clostridium] asparagiforme DSM 15981 TaxID=518636 RepID=C0D420_9FIRM|nr:hypothetical protein CLOSTASPAR_04011 [[Clostridium] asparagiforme DSM 15981]
MILKCPVITCPPSARRVRSPLRPCVLSILPSPQCFAKQKVVSAHRSARSTAFKKQIAVSPRSFYNKHM